MTKYDADLGDFDSGTALRARMSASMSDIHMRAGLLDRAVSQNRRRKARNRLTAATGVIAVAAIVATVIATGPGGPALLRPSTKVQAQTAAYVLNRAATAQVNSYHMISVDQNAFTGLTYTDVATQQQRLVSALLDSSGQPYLQIATEIGSGSYNETDIEYQHHVYSTFTTSSLDQGVRVTLSSFLPLQTNPHPATAFHEALKAGIITVVGHRSLNGHDTILIRVKPAHRLNGKSEPASAGTSKVPVPLARASWIWIDARTYLVVQTQRFVPSALRGKVTWSSVIDHVTWLSPTPQNLALLTLTPPAGFTKISYSELAQKYLGPIS